MKKFLFPIAAAIIAFILSSAIPATEAQAQYGNCPYDWHKPPCGDPPKPVPDPKKEAAKAASRYHQEARDFFLAWASVSCAADKLGYKPARAVCAAAGMGAAAAQGAKEYQDRIINDPFDPNYQELYIGRYLSYDDLELSVFVVLADDNPYVQNMAEHIQAIDMLGDRIAVSFDRAMSCYQAGIDDLFWYDCATWQTYWVQENLVYFGDRFVALAANFSYLADDLEPWIGQGVNSDFIYLLREFAAWTDWAGREYQQ